jgi:antitoxin ParD1/3/4
MTDDYALPPHLQQFVNEQLAAGSFHSESEIIRTALHLLEERYHSREALNDWLKREIDKGMNSLPAEPVTKEFWDNIRSRLAAGHSPINEA